MKKIKLLFVFLIITTLGFSQLISWNASSTTGGSDGTIGNFGTSPWPTSSINSNLTLNASFIRGVSVQTSGTPATSCWGGGCASGCPSSFWSSTGGNDSYAFYFTFSSKPGYTVSLSSITGFTRKSNSGPTGCNIDYSVNGGSYVTAGAWSTSSTSGTVGTSGSTSLSGISILQNVSPGTSIKIRIAPTGSTTGNWYFTNTSSIVVNGTVCLLPTITINPTSLIAYHKDTTYKFIAHSATSFNWQDSTTSHTWTNITSGTSPYLINGDTLKIKPVTQSMNGFKYRILANNGSCTTSSSVAVLSTSTTLPVKLEYFSAYKYGNMSLLKWSTASEINNDYFDIERSPDCINWESISKISSLSGNSINELDYQYTDSHPLNDINYYRLKQVDVDGEFEYSPIVDVDFNTMNNIIKYYDLQGREVSEIQPYQIYVRNLNGQYSKVLFTK